MRVLTGIVGVSIPVLLARSMSVSDFAAYATIGATAALSAAVSSLGVDRASLRFLPAFAGKASLPSLVRFLMALTLPRMLALIIVVFGVIWSGIWLPEHGRETLGEASQAIVLVVCLSLTNAIGQLASSFIQGFLQHGAYAVISFGTVLSRILVLILFLKLDGALEFALVMWIFIFTELAGAAAQMLLVLWKSSRQAASPGEFDLPSLKEVVSVSRANYVSYLVGIPWLAPSLILLVSHFTSREVTAAYAFFLTLAERARMFLPVQLLQGYVEPIWAKLYAQGKRVSRFREPAVLLLQTNLFFVALGLAILLAIGEQAIGALTKATYAKETLVLFFVLAQIGTNSLGGLLWIGMNATQQSSLLARIYIPVSLGLAMLLIPAVMLAGPLGVITTSCLPAIALLLALRIAQKKTFANLSFRLHKGLQIFAIALVAGAGGRLVSEYLASMPVEAMLVGGSFCVIIFMAGCLVTQRPNRAQVCLVKHFIRGAAR